MSQMVAEFLLFDDVLPLLRVGKESRIRLAVVVDNRARPFAKQPQRCEEGRGMCDHTVHLVFCCKTCRTLRVIQTNPMASFVDDFVASSGTSDEYFEATLR